MVNTILSDKTGTLTRNIMEFFKCSIGGISYGQGATESERANSRRSGLALYEHMQSCHHSRDACWLPHVPWDGSSWLDRVMDHGHAGWASPWMLLKTERLTDGNRLPSISMISDCWEGPG